ncbi:helix-turn-helix domain-containing protein [Rhodoferax sp.]|uniref:helix-turn-helix domain-containing protein n=1 Tax=Rhodoferax sp. TaxID=50421 RepID=UPI0027240D03|nr:helix-turn-helix domain-containing protein [Rhodoferax sp.]MDO9145117.1 helix-turn-helix domain-containing protein [Rhodoferax sp.]MDP3192610.1 helix-turn-helix domain-containing protein [Rhodoferax sp.]MDP3864536.1 helix-turn-helix domain-containing protein [Rhodoferax sp.]
MTPGTITKPHHDTRPAQIERVADFLEQHPHSTAKEIDAACDVGSVTKVISDMRGLGYDIGRAWRWRDVSCAGDGRSRMVRTYALIYRPNTQPDLFTPL